MLYLVERKLDLILLYFPVLQDDSSSFVSTAILGDRRIWRFNDFFSLKARGNKNFWWLVIWWWLMLIDFFCEILVSLSLKKKQTVLQHIGATVNVFTSLYSADDTVFWNKDLDVGIGKNVFSSRERRSLLAVLTNWEGKSAIRLH